MHQNFPCKTIIVSLLIWSLLAFMAVRYNRHQETGASPAAIQATESSGSIAEQNLPAKTVTVEVKEEVPEPPEPRHISISGTIRPGESLEASLKRIQLEHSLRAEVIKAFSTCLNFRKLRPDDTYTVIIDDQGELISCSYESSPLDIVTVEQSKNGYVSRKVPVEVENRIVLLTGTIQSNLFAAFSELAESPRIVHAFADIFSSKIDFNTEPRLNDVFSLVVEKFYKDNEFIGYGRILHAEYDGFRGTFEGFYYSSEKTGAAYFDPEGKEVGSSFLRSPIPFGRVSSGFTWKRKHPILGTTRPHLGVDLAAPKGTPVMAAADGIIEFAARNGGFGKQVVIKHNGGYRTHYGHLSGFGKGIKKGKRVRQKDIIGYVGSTGLSTGPHLDYRIQDQGTFKNPFSIKFKPRIVLKDEELAAFMETRDALNLLLIDQQSGAILLVKDVTLESGKNVIL